MLVNISCDVMEYDCDVMKSIFFDLVKQLSDFVDKEEYDCIDLEFIVS